MDEGVITHGLSFQEPKELPIAEIVKNDLPLETSKEDVNTTATLSTGLSLELPKEEPVITKELSQNDSNDSKDLGDSKMEEVRIESVDLNTTNISVPDTKEKSRFSLEKNWLYIRNNILYYTSCSTKKQQTNNNPK
jgi:hypothetical protein